MKNKVIFITLFFIVGVWQNVFAVPELKLPFRGGETWWCSQGNYTDSANYMGWFNNETFEACTEGDDNCSYQWSYPTHRINSSMQYAWDFNFGAGNDDLGKAVLAPAKGTIVYAQDSNSGWGNVVIIDYGDSSYGKIAHLSKIVVTVGQKIAQGEVIGYCGGTGGWPSHIHYQTQTGNDPNDDSTQSSFSDVSTNNGVPTGCGCSADDGNHCYTSENYYVPMYNYTFPNNSSEGWAEGNNVSFMSGGDTDSMYMNITGTNPGFISPAFCPTVYNANCPNVYADEVVIQFRAKVIGRSSSPTEPVTVYVKDQNDSWANSLTLETVSDSDYHYYVAYLSDITNASTKLVQQFSIELTEGSTSGNEYWEFDLKNNKFI